MNTQTVTHRLCNRCARFFHLNNKKLILVERPERKPGGDACEHCGGLFFAREVAIYREGE